MHTDQRFQAADAIATEVVDGELVLLQLNDGVYFGLDPLGTQVWNWLIAGCSVGQMTAHVTSLYPAQTPASVSSDIEALVRELLAAKLVHPHAPIVYEALTAERA
jgi:Coenzyme PQQ synthesis protein D (PqqD)